MSAWGRFRAAEIAANRSAERASNLAKAYPNRIAVGIEKYVPDRFAQYLDTRVIPHKVPTPTNTILKGATKVGKSVPVVGLWRLEPG
ncbi:hypothetical protein [Bounagaea algeriensis]